MQRKIFFLVFGLLFFCPLFIYPVTADDISFSGSYESSEDWLSRVAYHSSDLKLGWFRKTAGGHQDYGYDFSVTRKVAFVQGQVSASYKDAKQINTQEVSLMAQRWGFGLGGAVNTISLEDPKLLGKIRYAWSWWLFSCAVDYSSNFEDRKALNIVPRLKLPAWRKFSLVFSGQYQMQNEKIFRIAKADIGLEL